MDKSRREFLKAAGLTVLGAGGGLWYLRGTGASGSLSAEASTETAARQWAMVIDLEKTRDEAVRRACAEACHRAHNVPSIPDPEEEIKWIWTEKFENSFPDQIHAHTAPEVLETPVLVMCNHCTDPACVRVCPTQATWKRESDGIVMMDMHRCIGCRYCMAACPYGARNFNWRDPRPWIPTDYESPFPTRTKGVVEKCNFCADRLRDDLEPACVQAARDASGGDEPLIFGDLSDADSPVARLLRDERTLVRKVSAGTGPNVYYLV